MSAGGAACQDVLHLTVQALMSTGGAVCQDVLHLTVRALMSAGGAACQDLLPDAASRRIVCGESHPVEAGFLR
jgi:hypothetical protein